MFDDEVWFEPKLYGLGCGAPVHWKGWVLVALHIALALGTALTLAATRPWIFTRHSVALVLIELMIALVPMPLYALHTRGGWKWRWGQEE